MLLISLQEVCIVSISTLENLSPSTIAQLDTRRLYQKQEAYFVSLTWVQGSKDMSTLLQLPQAHKQQLGEKWSTHCTGRSSANLAMEPALILRLFVQRLHFGGSCTLEHYIFVSLWI